MKLWSGRDGHGCLVTRVCSQKVLLVEVRASFHHRSVSLSGRYPAATGCCSACSCCLGACLSQKWLRACLP